MLTKSTYLKIIITTLALSSSISAIADETMFKIAVVKKDIGSRKTHVLDFYKSMELCTAYIQTKNSKKSETACSVAITSAKLLPKNNNKTKYLRSLSYSNRGISRYINDDFSGAMDDLTTAILIDSNAITKGNLKLMKQSIRSVDPMDSIALSD
jgi:hypothetical protein